MGGCDASSRRLLAAGAPASTEELPLLTADQIRAAALAFPVDTAKSLEGFHVRHYALASDEALTALSHLFRAMVVLLRTTGPEVCR